MKIFCKKFPGQQDYGNKNSGMPFQEKSKINYLLNQFLIWGTISFVIYFIVKFYIVNV